MTELATDRSPTASSVTDQESVAPQPRRLGYQPAIDGLRGVAVMAVVLYHAGVGWMSGGFLGVDAFFVVSGFLITTLLIDEHAARGRIDLVQFWARRIRRLVPALVLLMVGIAAYVRWFADPDLAQSIRDDAVASLLYVSNWRFIFDQQSYFDLYSEPSPLRHTWSLAIEEQWYLIWPIVAGAALSWTIVRRTARTPGAERPPARPSDDGAGPISRRRLDLLALSCLGLAGGSAVLMALLSGEGDDVSRAYFGTDTRAQALLIGSSAAFLVWGRLRDLSRVARTVVAIVGIVGLVAVSVAFVQVVDLDGWLYTGGFFAIATGWAVVVVAATNSIEGPVHRLLAIGGLVAIGRISYGIYLWHWPIQLVLTPDRVALSPNMLIVVRLAVTIAFATLSYHLVEQPVRRYRPARAERSSRIVFGGAVAGALVAAATVAVVSAATNPSTTDLAREQFDATAPATVTTVHDVTEPRPEPASPPQTPVAGSADDAAPVVEETDVEAGSPAVVAGDGDDGPPATVAGADVAAEAPAVVDDGVPVRVVTVGDSVGFDVAYYNTGVEGFDIGTNALLGCGVLPDELWVGNRRIPRPDECDDWLDSWTTASAAEIVLVFLGTWEVFDPHIDGQRVAVGSPEWDTLITTQIQSGIDALTADGAHVVLMTVPCFETNGMLGEIPSTERDDPERIAAVNRTLRAISEANPTDVSVVDWAGYICPNGQSRTLDDGSTTRTDGVHPDIHTVPDVWRWLSPQLTELARDRGSG